LYLAQLNNIEIKVSYYFLTAFLTLIASATVAGIPNGGLVNLALILNGLNVDPAQIGLIFTVDWLM